VRELVGQMAPASRKALHGIRLRRGTRRHVELFVIEHVSKAPLRTSCTVERVRARARLWSRQLGTGSSEEQSRSLGRARLPAQPSRGPRARRVLALRPRLAGDGSAVHPVHAEASAGNAMTARRGRNGVFRRSALPSDGRVAQRARHFERSQIQAKASTKIDASVRLGGALAAIQLRRRGRRELRRWDPRIDAGARRRWSIVTECRRELSPIQDRRVDVCVASKAALTSRQR
jgi:hypothetical protein